MTSFYSRAAAMEFAIEFWDRPCRSDTQPFALGMDGGRNVPLSNFWDQRKAPSQHYEPRFVFSTLWRRDQLKAMPKPGAPAGLKPVTLLDDLTVGNKLEDCAHFLSQCLKAGGLKIREQWSVPMLLNELTAGEDSGPRPIAKTLCEKVPRAAAQRIIDAGLFEIGDMIGYFTPAAPGVEMTGFTHSGMYCGTDNTGVGHITCHTASRFIGLTPPDLPDQWFLVNPNYLFTLMHIPRASESMANIGPTLVGWWQMTQNKQTVFFYLLADGRAVRTTKAPTVAKAPTSISVHDSRGYWFDRHGKITICWRADGSLFCMDLSSGPKPKSATIDGTPASVARPGGLQLDI
jgi:hypothetical protein